MKICSTRPSVAAGIHFTSSGTSVPLPRTCRSIGPRLTASTQTPARSTPGAAGFRRESPSVIAIRPTSPTVAIVICFLRLFLSASLRGMSNEILLTAQIYCTVHANLDSRKAQSVYGLQVSAYGIPTCASGMLRELTTEQRRHGAYTEIIEKLESTLRDNSVAPLLRGQRHKTLIEVGFELGEGDCEVLGEDASFGDGGHEVGVAVPARENVQMVVLLHAGAGRFSQIHSHVETIRIVNNPQRADHILRKPHHFLNHFCRGVCRICNVKVRGDHQVPVIIWIAIQDDEVR